MTGRDRAPTARPSRSRRVVSHGIRLRADAVRLGYDARIVVDGVTLAVPTGQVTVVVGPNGCGKSTLLRGLGRLLRPRGGSVLLDGERDRRAADHARSRAGSACCRSSRSCPRGSACSSSSSAAATPTTGCSAPGAAPTRRPSASALERTDLVHLAAVPVDSLSGGQRQRVWLAMVLAQATPVLLLDEPTSFLDIAHQLDVLDLVRRLCDDDGTTVVMVLHDLAMAARYADHLVAMRDGRVVAEGPPAEVVTPEVIEEVFGVTATRAHRPGVRRPRRHPPKEDRMTTTAEPLVRTETPQFEATVVAVADLGGGMRRVTCAAEGLRTFVPCGPDEYFGLLMPPAGRPLVMPDPDAGRTCGRPWPRSRHDDRPALRWYTIRDHDPVLGQVDIDIMTHGDSGPGSAWTCRARRGDPVGIRASGALYRGARGARPAGARRRRDGGALGGRHPRRVGWPRRRARPGRRGARRGGRPGRARGVRPRRRARPPPRRGARAARSVPGLERALAARRRPGRATPGCAARPAWWPGRGARCVRHGVDRREHLLLRLLEARAPATVRPHHACRSVGASSMTTWNFSAIASSPMP